MTEKILWLLTKIYQYFIYHKEKYYYKISNVEYVAGEYIFSLQIKNKSITHKMKISKLICSDILNKLPPTDTMLVGLIYNLKQQYKISLNYETLDFIRSHNEIEMKFFDAERVAIDMLSNEFIITMRGNKFKVSLDEMLNDSNLLYLLPIKERLNIGCLAGELCPTL